MLNRGVITILCKQPFLDWFNGPARNPLRKLFSLADLNDSNSAFLISDDDMDELGDWIDQNYKKIFNHFLGAWHIQESIGPKERTRAVFDEWFDLTACELVYDTVGTSICNYEGYDNPLSMQNI